MVKQGAPQKYKRRAGISISVEEEVLIEVRKSGIALNDIFMKGWNVVIPSGTTGSELRKKQIDREIRHLMDKRDELDEEISRLENEKVELDIAVVQSKEEREKRDKLKYELFWEWKKQNQDPERKPPWLSTDPETCKWFDDRGCPISYGEVIKIWDEVVK